MGNYIKMFISYKKYFLFFSPHFLSQNIFKDKRPVLVFNGGCLKPIKYANIRGMNYLQVWDIQEFNLS